MQTALMSRSLSSPEMAVAGRAPDAAHGLHRCSPESHADHQFVAMLNGYRGSGGLARADEVLKVLKCHSEAHVARLARWIVKRKVICFEWRSQTWLPWFQFHRLDTTPQPDLEPVFTELTPGSWRTGLRSLTHGLRSERRSTRYASIRLRCCKPRAPTISLPPDKADAGSYPASAPPN